MDAAQILLFAYKSSLVAGLWATAIAAGLRFSPGSLNTSLRNSRLLSRALLLNLVILPGLIWILTRSLSIEPGAAIAITILAASAGGPYGLTATLLARGNPAYALALVSILQASRIIAIPFWVGITLPFHVSEILQVIVTLILYILLPFAFGVALERFVRPRKELWAHRATHLANLFTLILIVSMLLLYAGILAEIILSTTMGLILGMQLFGMGVGYWFGGPNEAERRAVAMTTAVRSSSTAIVIAGQVYGAQPQVAATIVAYGTSAIVIVSLTAWGMARIHSNAAKGKANDCPEEMPLVPRASPQD